MRVYLVACHGCGRAERQAFLSRSAAAEYVMQLADQGHMPTVISEAIEDTGRPAWWDAPVDELPAEPTPIVDWQSFLAALDPRTRAYFRSAQPRLEGSVLELTFPYSFHHKRAVEAISEVEPLLRSWLGPEMRVHLVLEPSQ